MEFSHADLERKFYNSLVKGKIIQKSGEVEETYFYVKQTCVDDDEQSFLAVYKYPSYDSTKHLYVSTYTRPTNKWPRVEIDYWNPDAGLYHTRNGGIAFVSRRIRRAYQVGLNAGTHNIQAYRHGEFLGSIHPTDVDPVKPRLFYDPSIVDKYLFMKGSFLCFNNYKVGIKANDGTLFLHNKSFLPFLPPALREKCTANP